ncbi:biopolymer transporter ExbD [Ferrimonas sp. SCSIO 43195]|uniref:ExbD/TolR family protein n=1 Tax=Ferrimonas sp. SCSIO 43195 TaxID=2822844 RepID=UPI002074DF81|nr:biopolymer transporter ExbD [Ferrimonas sp. SCSIO 43195]USD38877.1 biopolymer transporter ExbD [Ferrimonas sp. SCSIO 43195]
MIRVPESAADSAGASVDLTPLIDIIFIVLVFLLLTANTRLLALPVDVPEQAESALGPVSEDNTLAVNVLAADPHYALNQTPYRDWEEFKSAFLAAHSQHPDYTVVVAADKHAPIQPLMQLLALMQARQIDQTQILMEE